MPHDITNDQPTHATSRTAANNQRSLGISKPGVVPFQKVGMDKPVEDGLPVQKIKERPTATKAFTTNSDNRDASLASPAIKPFQLKQLKADTGRGIVQARITQSDAFKAIPRFQGVYLLLRRSLSDLASFLLPTFEGSDRFNLVFSAEHMGEDEAGGTAANYATAGGEIKPLQLDSKALDLAELYHARNITIHIDLNLDHARVNDPVLLVETLIHEFAVHFLPKAELAYVLGNSGSEDEFRQRVAALRLVGEHLSTNAAHQDMINNPTYQLMIHNLQTYLESKSHYQAENLAGRVRAEAAADVLGHNTARLQALVKDHPEIMDLYLSKTWKNLDFAAAVLSRMPALANDLVI